MTANRGFTMVEVVVALAISGLALVELAYLTRDAAQAHDRFASAGLREAEAEAFFRTVEQLVERIEIETQDEAARFGRKETRPLISGSAEAVRLVSLGPRILSLSKPVPFEIATAKQGRSQAVLRWEGAGSPAGDVLVTNAERLRFRYGARGEHHIVWQEHWQGPVLSLALLQVGLVESGTGRLRSKTIAVRPIFPAVCALRPLLTGCPQWK